MCPHCNNPVLTAKSEPIQLHEPDGGTLNGAKYSCMSCGVVLGLGIDPFAHKDEIVNELLAKLGKTKPL
jgi:hypothetical protein